VREQRTGHSRSDLDGKADVVGGNRPSPGPDVVAREKACRRGADTAAGASRAMSAASAGVSVPSCSGSWKRSSSIVGCLAFAVAIILVVGEVGGDGARGRC
jgi:hypothetical protein